MQAERPMIVDDASTLEQGHAKLEFGWFKADDVKGFDGAAGYGPIETVEIEIAFGWARNSVVDPTERFNLAGGAIKWVPLAADKGLSAGLKLEYEYEKLRGGPSAHTTGLLALATWAFEEDGPLLHVNLGREWLRADEGNEAVNVWGVGLDFPLTEALHLTLETFGAQHSGPERAIGLRYETIPGLKVSGAYGRGNDASFANLGIAWEF